MTEVIGQRELRNDNARIMRRVMAGESFVVTRNGVPIADLVPHQDRRDTRPWPTLREVQAKFRQMTPIDAEAWRRDLAAADEIFGPDDPLEDPWERRRPAE